MQKPATQALTTLALALTCGLYAPSTAHAQGRFGSPVPSTTPRTSFRSSRPVVIAVRRVKNMAGAFAESGVVETSGGTKRRVGFWKPSYEVRLAEILSNELANTGHFTIADRQNLYDIIAEQDMERINKKSAVKKNNITQANYIVIATLSDYIPNTSGSRTNTDGHFLLFGGGKDKTQVDTYVALDLRVIDTSTGTIKLSRTIEGTTSSVATAKRSTFSLLGLASNKNQKEEYETTAATRALRGALINTVDYLDCYLYLKDECTNKYEAMDAKRKDSTKGSLNLF